MQSRYEHAVGLPIVVCRLEVDLDRVQRRLMRRHRPGRERDWHLHRSGELDAILRSADIGEHVVAVDEHTPDEVANMIVSEIGW